ncbi:unnamed protein product [Effrenium voratum]|nr:unnamed protein product [Effrenium voratum]
MFFRRLQQMDGREAQSGAKVEEGCCSLLLQRCWANGAGGLVFVHLNLTETPQRLPQISCSLKIGPRENAVGSNSLSVAGPRAQADQVRAGPLTIDKALLRGGSASGLGVNMGRPLNLQNFSKAFKNFDSLPGLPAHAMHHGVQARVHALSLTSVTPNVAAVDMAGTSLVTCQMPRLGCLKIQFFKNWESSVSLMTAVQSGYTVPVDVPASWGCSPDKYQALEGGISSKQAFSTMLEEANTTSTWMMRFLGLCFAWIAVYCCFQPISASIDVVGDCLRIIPCVGGLLEDLLEGMVTCLLCVVSCCCGCSLGFLVIALMWLYMRPLIGGGLLAICLVLGIGGYFLAYQNKVNRPARTLEQGSELQKLNEPKDNAA